jgi:hypothetical protein
VMERYRHLKTLSECLDPAMPEVSKYCPDHLRCRNQQMPAFLHSWIWAFLWFGYGLSPPKSKLGPQCNSVQRRWGLSEVIRSLGSIDRIGGG